MNKYKMLQLADTIESAEPESFAMGSWFGTIIKKDDLWEHEEDLNIDVDDFLEEHANLNKFVVHKDIGYLAELRDLIEVDSGKIKIACDTTACIAGWAVINEFINDDSFYDKPYIEERTTSDIIKMAMDILGLSLSEASSLFYCDEGSVWDRLSFKRGFIYDTEEPITWILDNKKVARVLRDIANGEVKIIDDEWSPEKEWEEYQESGV